MQAKEQRQKGLPTQAKTESQVQRTKAVRNNRKDYSVKKRLIVVGVVAAAVAALTVCLTLSACSSTSTPSSGASDASSESANSVEVHVASLKGPTSIGLVSFMDQAQKGETYNSYDFSICGTADEILPSLIKGDIDIACIPANAASVVYNKTNGGIQVMDINTLGVLYIVSDDVSLSSVSDLAGKTVYMTGKGTTPEYVMNHLLKQAGLTDSVTLEYKSEATEVAAVLAANENAIGVLPEPYVTAVTLKNEKLAARVSLTDEWNALCASDGGQLVTGVTVVRTEFAQENPQVVQEFMSAQKASVAAVNENPSAAGELVVNAGIMDNATAAAKAIPQCNLVFMSGTDMKTALSGYLTALYNQDPSSVGGVLPADDFYMTSAL